jgi:ribosomal protein S18 acetylase RimI-like enzyme
MPIRQAQQADAQVLAELVYNSAPNLLTATLGIDNHYSALHFLTASLVKPEGQYGYKNHWVMTKNDYVIGCISAWHNQLSPGFHKATLKAITDFYGLEHALTILHINQTLKDCIPDITANEWCVGHLSVSDSYQRQGIGRALIESMCTYAQKHNKSFISLDVDCTNQGAIDFYLKLGFDKISGSSITPRMTDLNIGPHIHLTKTLSKG